MTSRRLVNADPAVLAAANREAGGAIENGSLGLTVTALTVAFDGATGIGRV